eukprot:721597-Pleurochrysis_carterae.AAC.1
MPLQRENGGKAAQPQTAPRAKPKETGARLLESAKPHTALVANRRARNCTSRTLRRREKTEIGCLDSVPFTAPSAPSGDMAILASAGTPAVALLGLAVVLEEPRRSGLEEPRRSGFDSSRPSWVQGCKGHRLRMAGREGGERENSEREEAGLRKNWNESGTRR